MISTALRVPVHQIGPLSDTPHCIEGTHGERKLARTLLRPFINLGLRNTTDLPEDLLETYKQVIFEKRDVDIFHHARAERLLTEMNRATFVLCGATVEAGIVQAAIGLRSRGFPVVLASDAVIALDDTRATMAYRRMHAKGVLFVNTREIVAPRKKPVNAKAFRVNTPAEMEALF